MGHGDGVRNLTMIPRGKKFEIRGKKTQTSLKFTFTGCWKSKSKRSWRRCSKLIEKIFLGK